MAAKPLDIKAKLAAIRDFNKRAQDGMPTESEKAEASETQEKKNKGGRPKKAAADKKGDRITMYLKPEMKKDIEKLAEEMHVSMNVVLTLAIDKYIQDNITKLL